METRRKAQLLLHLMLFSVLFSHTLAWPLFEALFPRIPFEGANELDQASLKADTDILPNAIAENDRNARQVEEITASDYNRHSGKHLNKKSIEQDSDYISEDQGLTKRQSTDALFNDQYRRLRNKQALKKFLESLTGNGNEEKETES